jgi:hypothetical protein
MITSIPNQPIDFVGSSLLVDCPDKRLPLAMSLEDVLRFQVGIIPPTNAYEYGDALRDWDVIYEWAGPGSWQYSSSAVCANVPDAGGYIEPFANIFNPDLGGVYLVELDIQSITGTSTFSMGDQTVAISAPGVQSFTIIAASTEGPRITLDDDDSRICVSGVTLYKFFDGTEGCKTVVELVNAEDDAVLYSFTSATEPQQFTVGSGVIGVTTPLFNVPVGACIYVRITHDCENDDNTLCSQPIRVDGDCQGTVVIRACLDSNAMGFAAPAIFEVRLKASLVRPRWELDSSEERWSDGTINRYYVDRQRVSDLMIQPVDEVLHPFLSALCMFDHVYINGVEYSVDATGYDPTYGDQTGTAAVQLTVRPKSELMRRVTCDEVGPGCDPANDPPCSEPNVYTALTFDEEDGWMLRVTVYSAIGFLPENLVVYVNDIEFASDVWISPTDFVYGPIPAGASVRITLSNKMEPGCDWEQELSTATTCADYPSMPNFVDNEYIVTAQEQAAIEGVGGLVIGERYLIRDQQDATVPSGTLWENNTGNTAVWNGSGWDIVINAPGTVINVLENAALEDYEKWWVVRGMQFGSLIYPSGKAAMNWLYPTASTSVDSTPIHRFFNRSFLTDEQTNDENLTDCRRGWVEISANGVTGWFHPGGWEWGELDGMTTGAQFLSNLFSRIAWYGGPTGTDFQGVSEVREFPL